MKALAGLLHAAHSLDTHKHSCFITEASLPNHLLSRIDSGVPIPYKLQLLPPSSPEVTYFRVTQNKSPRNDYGTLVSWSLSVLPLRKYHLPRCLPALGPISVIYQIRAVDTYFGTPDFFARPDIRDHDLLQSSNTPLHKHLC